jgi:hypothetical protein
LVVNGVRDIMIPVWNSYGLTFPTRCYWSVPMPGHGSLFQYHDSFVQQVQLFLDS